MPEPPSVRRRNLRRWPALVGLALLAFAGWHWWGDDAAPTARPPSGGFRVPVKTATVAPGEVVESVVLVGDVLSRRYAVLGFERSGRVIEVLADLGDVVVAGQPLARLSNAVLDEQHAVAEAAVAAAEAEAEYAAKEAARARELGSELVRQSEQDRLSSDAVARERRADQQRAEARRLAVVRALGELRAPFDGVITERHVTEGSYVDVGAPAFEIVDTLHREVRLEIPAEVAATLQPGAPVTLSVDELPGRRWEAHLHQLVPAADPSTRLFTGMVDLEGVDPEGSLAPGLFARARVERRRATSDTVVPSDALRRDEQGLRVVKLQPPAADAPAGAAPTAVVVAVEVLARSDERAAVRSHEPGLLVAGDRVVVTGVDNVYPGAALNPAADDATPGAAPADVDALRGP